MKGHLFAEAMRAMLNRYFDALGERDKDIKDIKEMAKALRIFIGAAPTENNEFMRNEIFLRLKLNQLDSFEEIYNEFIKDLVKRNPAIKRLCDAVWVELEKCNIHIQLLAISAWEERAEVFDDLMRSFDLCKRAEEISKATLIRDFARGMAIVFVETLAIVSPCPSYEAGLFGRGGLLSSYGSGDYRPLLKR